MGVYIETEIGRCREIGYLGSGIRWYIRKMH